GVDLFNSASGNLIEGNSIGTNAAGTSAVANGGAGVNINGANNNTVGGPSTAAANLISGNAGYGITVNPSSGTVVQNNFVGTGAGGSGAIANTIGAVDIGGSVT